jgi:N-acetylmuramoyl-L-alanine amidase
MGTEYHLLRSFIIAMVIALIPSAMAAGPLDINVIYPQEGQNIAPVDSTFIFGSVAKGADLTINGFPIDVHKDGGWLAFLPVSPGRFAFRLKAEKSGLIDTLTVTIQLPELPAYTYDSLYFIPGSFKPSGPLWIKKGDEIAVSFRSLPYCNAICVVEPTGDTIYMHELPPRSYYGGRNVFDCTCSPGPAVPESLLVRGIYEGSYIVPATGSDSLFLIYYIYPPSSAQIIWLVEHGPKVESPSLLPFHKLLSLTPIPAETSSVCIRVLDERSLPVAELKDSLTTIRTGSQKGYLCIHQPPGIRARIAANVGSWLKLELSDYQYGWTPDTLVVFLPPETTIPHSYIRRIRTVNYEDRVSVRIATSARHAFRVIENIDEKSITLYIYGADSDTDWIRYDNTDSLIDHIVWFQSEPGLYTAKVYLTEENIWGYDGYYVGHELYFDIKKPPKRKRDISDFRFVIDPGHSPDPGAIGPTGLTESEANLEISLRLKNELERRGAEVILTRCDDSPLPLYDRPKIAVLEKADIFISVHNNALPDGTNPFVNNGVSTYYYHPHSAPLARAVQNSMARSLGLKDFGFYHGNLAVNRPTQYPAILVECAFMMIPEREAMLKTKRFQKKIARAIIKGVEDFLRGRALTEWDIQQAESYGWE